MVHCVQQMRSCCGEINSGYDSTNWKWRDNLRENRNYLLIMHRLQYEGLHLQWTFVCYLLFFLRKWLEYFFSHWKICSTNCSTEIVLHAFKMATALISGGFVTEQQRLYREETQMHVLLSTLGTQIIHSWPDLDALYSAQMWKTGVRMRKLLIYTGRPMYVRPDSLSLKEEAIQPDSIGGH